MAKITEHDRSEFAEFGKKDRLDFEESEVNRLHEIAEELRTIHLASLTRAIDHIHAFERVLRHLS